MEDGGKLSFQELRGLTRCFGCKMDYLYSPVLSTVDPTTNKGKLRLRHLKNLVQQTEGMDYFIYRINSGDVLPKLESGKPVTYAAYRWACKNLQDVLDDKAQEEARQQRIRTEEIPSARSQKDVRTSLATRLRLVRERNKSRELEHRLSEMLRYVDHARVQEGEDYQVISKDVLALAEFSHRDLFGAVLLAFTYGRAKGYQMAKGT